VSVTGGFRDARASILFSLVDFSIIPAPLIRISSIRAATIIPAVVRLLMIIVQVLMKTAMLRTGVRLGVKVFMLFIEVTVKPLMCAASHTSHQQGGQRKAE
jgi:hypothetical protein